MSSTNNTKSYAGPPGITLKDIFRPAAGPLERQLFNDRRVIYTHRGRGGLGLLCRHWQLGTGHEILMPAYNCGTELDPFVHYGLKVVFYRVNHQARIEFDDLQGRVTARTRAIYVTHYFGWPQDLRLLAAYCQENNIYLIEDCALALFSQPVEQPIGSLGAAAIYSFPKTLPVPDGGALAMPTDESIAEPPGTPPVAGMILKEMLPLIKRTALRRCDSLGLYRHLPQEVLKSRGDNKSPQQTPAGLPEIPQDYYYNREIETKTASAFTRHILRHSLPQYIVARRRENYLFLDNFVQKIRDLKPLYPHLPPGVCPLSYPVLVKNRETLCQQLNKWGIAATRWWSGYHRAFDWSAYPDARHLKDHLLTLPVHQQLSLAEMEYIGNVLSAAEASETRKAGP